MQSQIQPARRELKFEVSEGLALEIKRYLTAYLRRDVHSPRFGELGYPVCSVYLDSEDALLSRQTAAGNRNRYKLRIRVYDDDPSHPAFAEIKRRDGRTINKQRATVDRITATALLSGARQAFAPIADSSPESNGEMRRQWLSLQEFCRLRDGIEAVGSTYVTYVREAFVSPDGVQWRATFDRNLHGQPYQLGEPIMIPAHGAPAMRDGTVVFELKFTDRFPRWMQELVRVMNLSAVPFPKYVYCRESLGLETGHPESQVGGLSASAPRRVG